MSGIIPPFTINPRGFHRDNVLIAFVIEQCLKLNTPKDWQKKVTTFSSIGTTAHCGLWPVEQCPSIFSYLPPTLSIFSIAALEEVFLRK